VRFYFISPNMISFFHAAVAVFASVFFISSPSLLARQVGVLLFEFRAFLDCLDGVVYRARAHQHANISNFGSIGYIIDGVADTFGCVVLLLGLLVYMRRCPPHRSVNQYLPLPTYWGTTKSAGGGEPGGTGSSASSATVGSGKVVFVLCCFCFQMAIAAAFWDRYIAGYHFLLEEADKNITPEQGALQDEVLKSAMMWVVIWFWKIMNSHALMEMLLLSIFLDKVWEFLTCVQYIGFIGLCGLVTVTECHFRNARNYIGRASTNPSVLH